jgi:hypothetical protein
MNNKVPVNYNGVVVGYTWDEGKTIEFIDSVAENEINRLISQGQIIGLSSRAIGEVRDDNTVEKTEEISYDLLHYEGNQTIGSISNVDEIFGLTSETLAQTVDKLELNISSEFSGWIASLLERGLMEYQTSRWDVPDEVVNCVKEFYEHEQSK